ncbi:GNAT family N-acetyltransferase [Ancylobacter sp. 6x-1]|uniref:GNAT family N-acetyltransferase n=1 Tax=Ancylobacter crimeensis TaxID=2579147 RepID=A0ABT0DEQ7_9HYPH|nr:GNAT family N-acetyltransferase [Ancylobacter crimeensis]MCK0198450.1 GNAT family N-acetyltransferase [Ancylobacter crimeensis]
MIEALPTPALLESAGLSLRAALTADLAEIRRLRHDAWRAAGGRAPEPAPVDAGALVAGRFFLAEIEGEPVGCAGWMPTAEIDDAPVDRPNAARADAAQSIEAGQMVAEAGVPVCLLGPHVHPLFIRNGIGAALLEHIEADLRAAGLVTAQALVGVGSEGFLIARGWRSRGAQFSTAGGRLVFLGMAVERRLGAVMHRAA